MNTVMNQLPSHSEALISHKPGGRPRELDPMTVRNKSAPFHHLNRNPHRTHQKSKQSKHGCLCAGCSQKWAAGKSPGETLKRLTFPRGQGLLIFSREPICLDQGSQSSQQNWCVSKKSPWLDGCEGNSKWKAGRRLLLFRKLQNPFDRLLGNGQSSISGPSAPNSFQSSLLSFPGSWDRWLFAI